jgi:hypothetical protein
MFKVIRGKKKDIYVERNPNGSYVVSDGKRKRVYYFYSEKEAVKKFKRGL